MRIESNISYWEDGFLTYNPEKIRDLFFEHFPNAISNKNNFSRLAIERFLKIVEERESEQPEFIIDDYWEQCFRNGPVYKFEIPFENEKNIETTIKRFRVSFEADFAFDYETECKIIIFLKLLKYGRLSSSHKTKNFSEPIEDYKDHWKLMDN